jgi:hypothetical protein
MHSHQHVPTIIKNVQKTMTYILDKIRHQKLTIKLWRLFNPVSVSEIIAQNSPNLENHEEIENLNRPIMSNEIELLIKKSFNKEKTRAKWFHF